jgi:PIN domain nuclease of toxin-antitoxin system
MKLLLDTHALLWYTDNDPRLSPAASRLLADPHNELSVSMATSWEIAIKVGLKKLSLSAPYSQYITQALSGLGITLLPISLDDCSYYETLPFPLANHRDPFDRMLITHAFRHGLTVVGNDAKFDAYGVTRLW